MKFLQKVIPKIFITIFSIILILLYGFDWVNYHLKRKFLFPNFLILIVIVVMVLIYCLVLKNKKLKRKTEDVSDKNYKTLILVISLLLLAMQIIITTSIYFYTDWDVKVIRDIVSEFINKGNLKDNFYLSIYPNNLLLTALLVGIKSIPFVGSNYLFLLIINCILVNASGIIASLTVRNLKQNNKLALMVYIVMCPLIILSPWIVIPYTDTFGILFPVLVTYFYTKQVKRNVDYFLIGFFSIFGFYIKPTIIIVLMAIIITEVFSELHNFANREKLKKKKVGYLKTIAMVILGILLSFTINKSTSYILKFKPVNEIKKFTFIHYLAMGQNDKTLGAYSQDDVDYSIKNGKIYDLKKFKDRVMARSINEQIEFYSKKTLLNFNDGSFSWGLDGVFFYKKVNVQSKLSEVLRSVYYSDGKYYLLFIEICQFFWLLVLTLCPFISEQKNNKGEIVIMLSLIGIAIFLTIFEPRTRYLYCYSPLFVICSSLGYNNLKNILKNKVNSKK